MKRRVTRYNGNPVGVGFVGPANPFKKYASNWHFSELRKKAQVMTQTARYNGSLPNVKTLACADCGRRASQWDHRDYSKPLAVEPVCRSCNRLRGPALHAVRPELATQAAA